MPWHKGQRRKPYTAAEIARVIALREDGHTVRTIALMVGISYGGVAMLLRRHGYPGRLPKSQIWEDITRPHTYRELAEKYGWSYERIVQMKRRARRQGYPVWYKASVRARKDFAG